MAYDPDEPVDLVSVRTEFEAETIAQALLNHGVQAKVMGGMLTGFRAEAPAWARVMVRRADLDAGRMALRALQAESVDIDWSGVDTGAGEAGAGEVVGEGGRPVPGRRWAWTLVLAFLLPVGAFISLLTAGRPYDPAVRAIGPTILMLGIVIVLWLFATRRDLKGVEEGREVK